VLRVLSDVLVMTTVLWPDEVRTPDFAFLSEDAPQVRPQEMTMATSLIDSLSEPVFEPGKYQDDYREALDSLIQAKIAGKDTTNPGKPGEQAEVVDLMSALQASVTAAKKTRTGTAAKKAPVRRTRKAEVEPVPEKPVAKKPAAATRPRRTPKSA
jgi:DNA end-binding protein Ku